jgi:hypothetical protein
LSPNTQREREAISSLSTRLLSLATLVAFSSGVLFVCHEAYRALTDAFVAPLVLSPDNELVLQNKLRATELYAERARAEAMRDGLALEVAAGEKAEERLEEMFALVAPGTPEASDDVRALREQREVLERMAREQRALVEATAANLADGLVTRTDLARETHTLSQVQVALFENARALLHSTTSQREQATRIELELLQLRTEVRGKRAEIAVLSDKLARVDALEAQLRERPIFQAMDRSLDVAFVPYTQIEGVRVGSVVYECVWGLLFCEPVGRVSELLPGEVAFTDPWGKPARGQYAVLTLSDSTAAQSRSLRVRPADALAAAAKHVAAR